MGEGISARQRLDFFRQLQPPLLGRIALLARLLDARREIGEAGRVAGGEVGIVKRLLVPSDLRIERVDLVGEEVVVALVLVAELGRGLRRRRLARSPSTALRAVPLPRK